jgi:hypothetical protein
LVPEGSASESSTVLVLILELVTVVWTVRVGAQGPILTILELILKLVAIVWTVRVGAYSIWAVGIGAYSSTAGVSIRTGPWIWVGSGCHRNRTDRYRQNNHHCHCNCRHFDNPFHLYTSFSCFEESSDFTMLNEEVRILLQKN